MSRNLTIAVALIAVVAAVGTMPGALADESVSVEDGGTYEKPVTLQFDVSDGDGDYNVRTADGALVVQVIAEDGTVTLETDHLDAGDYVLNNPDTGETLYHFSLVGDPATETPTPSPTATESEPIDSVAPELRVPTEDRSAALDATDSRVFWAGQDLAFRVDGDSSYVLSHDGDQLGRLTGSGHYRYVNTSTLDTGLYTVQREDGHEVYRFSLAAQALSVTATDDGLALASNRAEFDLVLTGENLTDDQLLAAVPAATRDNGQVVVSDVGADEVIAVEAGALPAGNHSLSLTVVDTRATANTTLSVSMHNGSTTPATETPKEAPATATPTATTSPTPPETETATEANNPSPTSVDGPGFGAVAVALSLFLFVVVAGRR